MTTRPRKKIPAALRARIFARDGHRCIYCGCKGKKSNPLTLDHVIPHSLGGADTAANLVTACSDCNRDRGIMPIDVYAIYHARYRGHRGVAARVLRALSTPLPPK